MIFGQVADANFVDQCVFVFLVGNNKFAFFAIYIAE